MLRRLFSKPLTWLAVTVLGLGAAFALYWFQPWRLVTDTTVSDSLSVTAPPAAQASGRATPSPATASPAEQPPADAEPAKATVVAEGRFVTHEHDTTGTARVVRAADGSHQLELVGLDTSDGPDLRVWLSDQPVREGKAGWHVFDDGAHVELGRLKGNRGDQVYRIDGDIDPAAYRSVSIWCKRFSVSFGAAALT